MHVSSLRGLFKRILPERLYRQLVLYTRDPPVGRVDLGDLGSTKPVSEIWGLDRGQPVDRYYINRFLAAHVEDIRGLVLEIGDNRYTRRYGGERVQKSDVLHLSMQSKHVTIVADLTRADHIPTASFDCIICTQTLHFIYEKEKAVATLCRLLRPNGVLLATFPGISQISRYDMEHWGDYWRFTSASARRLFGNAFSGGETQVRVYGNVLAATAFLHGLAVEELRQGVLDVIDPDYEVTIGVRAVKSGETG